MSVLAYFFEPRFFYVRLCLDALKHLRLSEVSKMSNVSNSKVILIAEKKKKSSVAFAFLKYCRMTIVNLHHCRSLLTLLPSGSITAVAPDYRAAFVLRLRDCRG